MIKKIPNASKSELLEYKSIKFLLKVEIKSKYVFRWKRRDFQTVRKCVKKVKLVQVIESKKYFYSLQLTHNKTVN